MVPERNSGDTRVAELLGAFPVRTAHLTTRTLVNARSGLLLSVAFALAAGGAPWAFSLAGMKLWGDREPSSLPLPGFLVAGCFLYFLLALALTSYLRKFGQPRLRLFRTQLGILAVALIVLWSAQTVRFALDVSALWLPVSLAPLWVAASFDRRAGFVIAVAMTVALAALVELQGLVLCVLLARGMTATLVYLSRRTSRQFLYAGALSGVTALLVLLAGRALLGSPVFVEADWRLSGHSLVLATLGGGLVEGAVAALLRAPAERVLGHVSRERLLQLTDLEQPLLQRLAHRAPGTFEHSRAMANLAEQAASSIGADALLTRVGAYYHDLGKTVEPKYFVENLDPGEASPHDALAPEESARRIVGHVVEGTRILRAGKIPEPVVEFAYTHHGTQTIEYFLNKARQQASARGGEVEVASFRYPGMKPQTKETAILMLVDSIEAASRTIDPPDRTRFRQMVQRIVQTKLEQGQLDHCNLSLAELRIIQERMVETLAHMHHHRIKYPWQAERAEQFGVPSSAVGPLGALAERSGTTEGADNVVVMGRGARK